MLFYFQKWCNPLKIQGFKKKSGCKTLHYHEIGESIEIKNAVGVAYIRLREYDKAQGILETALGEAQTEEQQACILTNLAAINSLTGFHEEAYDFLVLAEQKKIDNPIKQLVLESNLPSVSFRLFNPELSQRLDNSGFFTLFV